MIGFNEVIADVDKLSFDCFSGKQMKFRDIKTGQTAYILFNSVALACECAYSQTFLRKLKKSELQKLCDLYNFSYSDDMTIAELVGLLFMVSLSDFYKVYFCHFGISDLIAFFKNGDCVVNGDYYLQVYTINECFVNGRTKKMIGGIGKL